MTASNFINTPQGFFHYHLLGSSETRIHFCHGNSLSAGTYLPFLERLAAKGFRVYASDLRGHGYSTKDKTARVRNWDIFIKDLEQIVSGIAKPPVIGMGHSIGGYFTYAAAALYPHLFSKLVLIDPIVMPRKIIWLAALGRKTGLAGRHPLSRMARGKKSEFASKEEALNRYMGKGMFKTWKPEFVKAYVETAIEQDTADTWELCCPPEFEAQIYEAVPFDTWSHATRIRVPVYIIRGGTSDLFEKEASIKLHRKLKKSTLIELDTLGHFLTMEDPDRVLETILPFLNA